MDIPTSVSKQISFLKKLVSMDQGFIESGSDPVQDLSELKSTSVEDVANAAFSNDETVKPLCCIGAKECYDFVISNNLYVDIYSQTREDYYAVARDDSYSEVANATNFLDYINTLYTKWLS